MGACFMGLRNIGMSEHGVAHSEWCAVDIYISPIFAEIYGLGLQTRPHAATENRSAHVAGLLALFHSILRLFPMMFGKRANWER